MFYQPLVKLSYYSLISTTLEDGRNEMFGNEGGNREMSSPELGTLVVISLLFRPGILPTRKSKEITTKVPGHKK